MFLKLVTLQALENAKDIRVKRILQLEKEVDEIDERIAGFDTIHAKVKKAKKKK